MKWVNNDGDCIGCMEKNKVLEENFNEIKDLFQDAFDDAFLLDCDMAQFKENYIQMIKEMQPSVKKPIRKIVAES